MPRQPSDLGATRGPALPSATPAPDGATPPVVQPTDGATPPVVQPTDAVAPEATPPAARPTDAAAETAALPPRARSPRDRPRVAAIIPAQDEARRIAATVRAARAIPGVDLVLVVDDGSEDETQHVARDAGAVVVRHSHNRGRAAALETGAAVVAMRDVPGRPPRSLLLLVADLAEAAVNVAPLVPPVTAGDADMTVALLPPVPTGRGLVVSSARRAIAQLTGWTPGAPLSPLRCLTRDAFEAATPLAHGAGVEPAMTIDLLRSGFRVLEVPIELRHHPGGGALRNQVRRVVGARDVELAINARRMEAAADVVRDRLSPSPRRGR